MKKIFKKSILILLILSIFATVNISNVFATEEKEDTTALTYPYFAGDVDNSQSINANDALIILKCAVGKINPTSAEKARADANGDGNINASDALQVLKVSVGKATQLKYVCQHLKTKLGNKDGYVEATDGGYYSWSESGILIMSAPDTYEGERVNYLCSMDNTHSQITIQCKNCNKTFVENLISIF